MEEQKNKKPVEYNRLAGYAFIGAGAAWLLTGFNRGLAASLLALGIIFLALPKNNKDKQ